MENKRTWYIKIIMKSGKLVYGALDSALETPSDVSDSILEDDTGFIALNDDESPTEICVRTEDIDVLYVSHLSFS